jgi:hypothetical protein
MMRDDNESQAIAPLPDAKYKSRAQCVLLNQAAREENSARTALREAKELRQKADAKELEANRLRSQAAELRAASRQLEEK